MDKYEYRLKLDEIKETVSNGEYAEAARLADSVNWNKVKNANTLCLIGSVYKKVSRTEDAREIYRLAYKRSPGSKNALYYLCELSIKLGEAQKAEEYYKEFLEIAPRDQTRFILGYKIACLQDKPLQERIEILEDLKRREYIEEWAYELAFLYYQADQAERCINACDELAVWFGDGEYVRKALELKTHFQPLSAAQQAQYERITRMGEAGSGSRAQMLVEHAVHEELAREVRKETQRMQDETRFAPEPADAGKNAGEAVTASADPRETRVEKPYREVPYVPGLTGGIEIPEKSPAEPAAEEIPAGEAATEAPVSEETAAEAPVSAENAAEETAAEAPVSAENAAEETVSAEIAAEGTVSAETAAEEAVSEEIVSGEFPSAEVYENRGPAEEKAVFETPEQTAETIRAAMETVRAGAAALFGSASLPEDVALCASLTAEMQELAKEMDAAIQDLKPAEPETPQVPEEHAKEAEPETPQAPEESVEETEPEAPQVPEESVEETEPEIPQVPEESVEETEPETLQVPEEIIKEIEPEAPQVPEENVKETEPETPQAPEELSRETEPDLTGAPGPAAFRVERVKAPQDDIDPRREMQDMSDAFEPLEEIEEMPGAYELQEDMLDDDAEEEEIQPAQEAQPAAPDLLSDEQRAYFSYFLPVPGMEAQIYDTIEGICQTTRGARNSVTGNAVIIGEEGSGKTVLATSLIRVIQEKFDNHGARIGKISAASLNRRDFAALMPKVAGGYLIVESAGELTRESAIRMSQIMEQNTEGLLVILEDNAIGIRKALDLDYGFAKKFTQKIRIPIFTIDELVTFGKAYAQEKNCEIDALGVLALTTRINNIQKLDHVTTLTEVKQIMDEAIDSARNGSGRKLFRARRGDAGEALVLQESDFDV